MRVKSAVPSGVIWRGTNICTKCILWKRQSLFNWIKGLAFTVTVIFLSCYCQQFKWAFVSISLEWLDPEVEELKWISKEAASSCYTPKTGVQWASTGLMWGCCREVAWRGRPLISDLRASMASGWVSRKPRSQKAAGPALHWKTKNTKHSMYYKTQASCQTEYKQEYLVFMDIQCI